MKLGDLQRLELRNQTEKMEEAARQADPNYQWAIHGYTPICVQDDLVNPSTWNTSHTQEESDALEEGPPRDSYVVLVKELWSSSLGEISIVSVNPELSVLRIDLRPVGMSDAQRFLWFGYVTLFLDLAPAKALISENKRDWIQATSGDDVRKVGMALSRAQTTPNCCPDRVEYVCSCPVPHLQTTCCDLASKCKIHYGTLHFAVEGYRANTLAHELGDYARALLVAAAGASADMLYGETARARDCPEAFRQWVLGLEWRRDLFEYAEEPMVFAGVRFSFEE